MSELMTSDQASLDNFVNRDMSWLAFNRRVLQEAQDASQPLLERSKFLAITSSNLDEFVMVRMAELSSQRDNPSLDDAGWDGEQQFCIVRSAMHEHMQENYRSWNQSICPALAEHGFILVAPEDWQPADRESLASYYRDAVEATLTPLAVDPTRPFPLIANLALTLAVLLEDPQEGSAEPLYALVVVPKMPRIIALPGGAGRYALLEDVVETFLPHLFPGYQITTTAQLRVTRDASLEIDEDAAGDFLTELEEELRNRGRGKSLRLELRSPAHPGLVEWIQGSLRIDEQDIVLLDGPLDLSMLFALPQYLDDAGLSFSPISGRRIAVDWSEPFVALREQGDQLLHHPYDSFTPIVDLVQAAADDPQVLAIKQTLYRVSGDSPIVNALVQAAHNGKQVTVLVELKARFDEQANIRWARRLEEAGAHVIYGLKGLKVHAKLLLIIRRDEDGIRRYSHLGTGNYNDKTARIYTDCSIMTCNEAVGRDVAALFNVLTGFAHPPDWERLVVAPQTLRSYFVACIEREIAHARQGRGGRIVAKCNSLVDPGMVRCLYRASQAGVQIDLIVRGMCILRPGVPGLSENIRVRSLVGRFLEHSRIFFFANQGNPQWAIASADWMTRNLDRRVEYLLRVTDARVCERLAWILRVHLSDQAKARIMMPDGSYRRALGHDQPGAVHAQAIFADQQAEVAESLRREWKENPSTDPLYAPGPDLPGA